ncbi:tetraacyldisaccharide 4'-kinase [Sphingobacterium shayense]|uniref:tetraacyldisaccharide 4'-kinase n=1 Tax=Sphingobacterium shayense TaxID=626343 RepID=UPI0015524EC1|nr:tetraacyldisaccharide 4'-kinase [Sphingobacterium shayense]NQD70510.1 tetraacyldisaccharide 4'-kinase [Sphingobacterium shayense]
MLRIILFPISIIYGAIMWLRNRFYDYDLFRSTSFTFPVVVIGNLAVGGTGKSPMAEYILRLISPNKDIMLLSRGYGRKTKGFREVTEKDGVHLVGDEPLQIKRKFPHTRVFVCESRVLALKKIGDNTSGVLLDDAYQHRALTPSFTVLLFDYKSLLGPILPLPTGNFRDGLPESKRANIIVITKCPDKINSEIKFSLESKLRKYSSAQIFYAAISYGNLENDKKQTIPLNELCKYEAVLFTGIAKPEPLLIHLKSNVSALTHISFRDHHPYSSSDLKKISNTFQNILSEPKIIITTEKDFQRLPKSFTESHPIYIVPIQQQILFGQKMAFDSMLSRAFHIKN